MSDLQNRYRRLLRFYPKNYRDERADEIVDTLIEASSPSMNRPALRDVGDIALHGIQMRLGLTSERFGGRVLNAAAMPGLAMAAAFSVYFFVWAELYPFLDRAYGRKFIRVNGHWSSVTQSHFGAFSTTGVVIYLAWLLILVGSLARPDRQRVLAALGVAVTALATAVGKEWFAAPRLPLTLVIVAFALPALLAPTTEYVRHRGASVAVAIGLVFCVTWYASRGTILSEGRHPRFMSEMYGSLYATSDYRLGDVALSVAVVSLLGAITCIALRRKVLAGAVAVLSAPWLIVDYTYHVQSGYDVVGTILVLAVPIIWLVGTWVSDLWWPASDHGQPQPAS